MSVYLVSCCLLWLALVVLGMSAGVLAGRPPIAGSCGGIANLGIEKNARFAVEYAKCDEVNAQQASLVNKCGAGV